MRLLKRLLVLLASRSPSFAYHVSFDVKTRVGNGEVKVPVIRGMGLELLRGSEEGVRKVIAHVLRGAPGTFVDVGANIGQTLIKVAGCDPDRSASCAQTRWSRTRSSR